MPTCSNSCSEGDSFYNRQVFLRTLIATFVIGLLAHAYCFFNTTFGHDGLYCLTSPSNEVAYKVSLGRFSQYLNFLFRGYVSAPWALGALSLWWLSLGNYCVLRLIRVKELLPLALICGLTVTSIAVTICNATCIHEIDNYALAFFLSALGVYVAVSPRRTWMFAPLIIAFATGLYQAYFSMSCSLAVVYLVLQVLQGRDFKENVRLALKLFGVLVAGILVYALIHKGVLSVFDFEEREAYNGITEATNVSGYVPIVIPLLKGVYKYVFMHFLQPATDHSSLLLLVNLFCDDLDAREFELRDEVKAMPEFPHQGYCQMIDGRMVIKLSPPAEVIN